MILQIPPLRPGSNSCYHYYEDAYGGYYLECIYCGKEITKSMWERSL